MFLCLYLLKKSIICKEYPQDWSRGKEAYYPINTARNHLLLSEYQNLARQNRNLILGGRLGVYVGSGSIILHSLKYQAK